MTEKQRKKCLCIKWMCVAAWAVIAVSLSHQEGIATSELSYGISERICGVLEGLGFIVSVGDVNYLLRKAAHILIYLVFGGLIYDTLACTLNKPAGRTILLSAAVCLSASVLDETQKIFISGRHCDPEEILLNFIAAVSGILIVYFANKTNAGRNHNVEETAGQSSAP